MPTTANFSLEYPDDNSSVDIAGHFETLADDVDEAINTRLALTGGTLTGSLSGTSLSLSSTLSVTGTTTLAGDLTISKASPGFKVSSSSGNANAFLERPAGSWGQIYFRTGTSTRWVQWIGSGSESGSNAGSDFGITRYDDAGSSLGTALTIIRSTGDIVLASTTDSSSSTTGAFKTAGGMGIAKALYVGTTLNVTGATTLTGNVTMSGDLTISKSSNLISTMSTTTGYALNFVDSPPGQLAGTFLRTSGAHRWAIVKTEAAESGSNAGSDLVIKNYNDAGSVIGSPLTITRSTSSFTLTGDLTVSKTSPSMVVTGSGLSQLQITSTASNYAQIELSRAAGQWGATFVRTGSTLRWGYGVNGDAESGANAGSNFVFYTYNDAGGYLGNPITITRSTGDITLTGTLIGVRNVIRKGGGTGANAPTTITNANTYLSLGGGEYNNNSYRLIGLGYTATYQPAYLGYQEKDISGATKGDLVFFTRDVTTDTVPTERMRIAASGKTTLDSVGATAGLELGSSGPRMMSGTGSPEGVVTAPIGSIWFQSDSTVGVTHWKKASGVGNTGWVVMSGDTGWRNIAASISNGWTVSPHMHLRRTGNMVTLYVRQLDGAAASATTFVTLPTGFRPAYDFLHFPVALSGSTFTGYGGTYSTGEVVVNGTSSACTGGRALLTFPTSNAWPSSLPGSAA